MAKNLITVTINGNKVTGTSEELVLLLGALNNNSASTKQTGKKASVSTKVEKVSATKATGKVSVGEFEPKKDKDGQYNWASYKAQRTKFVEAVSGKTLHGKNGQWLDGAEYKKLAKKFEDKFHYVKKSDR